VIPYAALIEFTDHCHIAPGTWTPIDELEEVGSCGVLTVGWVIADTADTIVICSSITEAGDATGVFVIARPCVRRLERMPPAGYTSSRSQQPPGSVWWRRWWRGKR